jgi:allantoin racemase
VHLLLVNPNTTVAMTDAMVASARTVAGDGVRVTGLTATAGVASVETAADDAIAAAEVVSLLREGTGDADAVIIGCFDDPGLAAAQGLCDVPVVGIGAASMLLACALGRRFGVLTTTAPGLPIVGDQVARAGLSDRLAGVRALGLEVVEIEADAQRALGAAREAGERAVREDGADVLCLGCGTLADTDGALELALGVPVIDPIFAAVLQAEALVRRRSVLRRPGPDCPQAGPRASPPVRPACAPATAPR